MWFAKRKRDKFWHVFYKTRTGIKELSTRQENYEDAKKVVEDAGIKEIEMIATARMLNNAAAMNAVFGRVVTCAEAYDEWTMHLEATKSPTTAERYGTLVKVFLKSLGWPEELGSIGSPQIDKFLNDKFRQYHRATRNIHRSALSSFFNYCHNEGWLNKNPVANVPVKLHLLPHHLRESKHRRPFEPHEFDALIKVAKAEPHPFWYIAVMIGRWTGLRWGDVINLEWHSVGKDAITVWTDKRDRRVCIPMPDALPPAFELARTHPLNQPAQFNDVPERKGKVIQSRPCDCWGQPTARLRELLERAGVATDLSFHCLRYTFAIQLAKSGMPLKEIARRMAHFSEKTTLRYLRPLFDEGDYIHLRAG